MSLTKLINKDTLENVLEKQGIDKDNDTLLKYMETIGDSMFMAPCQEFVQNFLLEKDSPVYQYRFSYPGPVDVDYGSAMIKFLRGGSQTLFSSGIS